MKRFILVLFIAYSFLLVGCRSEMKNPHLVDPIYKSIHEKTKQVDARIASERKTIEDLQVAYDKTEPMTYQRTVARKDLQAAKTRLSSLEQEHEYLKIRLKRREIEDRINYKIAFQENRAWPDPKEWEQYQVYEKLVSASKKWDDRVPKLDDRIKAAWKKDEKAVKEQASLEETDQE